MMTDFWKTKRFQRLSLKWEKKLMDSGFEDVEKKSPDGERWLKTYQSVYFNNNNQIYIQSKQEFYNLVVRSLNSEKHITPRDRLIMKNFSEGVKQKETLRQLAERGIECNRITITRVITRYIHRWNIPILKPRKKY